jgi:dihydroorotate dehydrogenase (NAD+) catalytic subunit
VLETRLNKLVIKNPFILASGIMGVTAATMTRVAKAGCGAITTKSIGPEPKKGYINPTVVELGNGSLINAMGLPNPGCKKFLGELEKAKKHCSKPIFVSIFGETIEDFVKVAKTLQTADPEAFELNISCPHGGKYGATIGEDSELVEKITRAVKKETKNTVFVKISPNLTDISVPVKAAIKGGADGIVAINTVRAMAIDVHSQKPILANKFGGLSGTAIKPIAIKCIYDLYSQFGEDVPIIGVGGITKWQDVIEFLLAGATAVQIGTALAYCQNPQKISIFNELQKGVKNFLKEKDIKQISELIGKAHQ